MADDLLSLSSSFPEASEADWLTAVEKALKGRGIDSITRKNADGLSIHPLYRESDIATATDPLGTPGIAPFLRGPTSAPDPYLPWDIRQSFGHPVASITNTEILRDLERGASSIELMIDASGQNGAQLTTLADFETALDGVDASIATVALDHAGGFMTHAATLLGLWAEQNGDPANQNLDFNMDPLGCLARTGQLSSGLDGALTRIAKVSDALGAVFPKANLIRIDARLAHEAGGSEAQELGVLIASAVDTLRRLSAQMDIAALPGRMIFTLALDANYGIGVAKIRAARRLWARCLEALGLPETPMKIQGVSSARMLTRYDAWTNMLRNTAAAFAGAVGGADILTIRPFNEALGIPEELGRRIARNTQIMAMEESQLGRVADPTGGAWFTESFADELARAAWTEFQTIESEDGLAQSLIDGKVQARIAEVKATRDKAIAKRKVPITGVSEFPLLEEIAAPVAEAPAITPREEISDVGVAHFVSGDLPSADPLSCEALQPARLSEAFEALRDAAAGKAPTIFLATLGPLSEHNARADFARNLFAAGGLSAQRSAGAAKLHLKKPQPPSKLLAASSPAFAGPMHAMMMKLWQRPRPFAKPVPPMSGLLASLRATVSTQTFSWAAMCSIH